MRSSRDLRDYKCGGMDVEGKPLRRRQARLPASPSFVLYVDADQIHPLIPSFSSIQERLDQAARHGAIPINLNDVGARGPLEIIKGRTEGRGADAILEIVG